MKMNWIELKWKAIICELLIKSPDKFLENAATHLLATLAIYSWSNKLRLKKEKSFNKSTQERNSHQRALPKIWCFMFLLQHADVWSLALHKWSISLSLTIWLEQNWLKFVHLLYPVKTRDFKINLCDSAKLYVVSVISWGVVLHTLYMIYYLI